MQVARQPGQIQPGGIVDAAEAQHHSPHGFVFKQAAPFGKAQRVAANVDASGIKVGLLIGGEGDILPVAIEHIPADSDEDPQHADGNEHPAPAHHQHHRGKDRRADRDANRRGGVKEAHRAAALFNIKPVVDHLDAARVHRRFADPHADTHQHELGKAMHHPGDRLEQRPEKHAQPQHDARAFTVQQRPAGELGDAVGQRENGQQCADFGGAEPQLFANR